MDKETIVLLSMDIICSYFQDKFSTVHYLDVKGCNGTGKSVFGDMFEALGYRTVNMTDPTQQIGLESSWDELSLVKLLWLQMKLTK